MPGPERFVPGPERFVPGPERFVPGPERFVPGPERFVPGPERFLPLPAFFAFAIVVPSCSSCCQVELYTKPLFFVTRKKRLQSCFVP